MTKFKNFNSSIFLVSLGTGLEYYDFVIYGVMAYYLSDLFFPNLDSSISIIQSFSIFAVGYIIRPVGGIIFGILGDKFGRKPTFTCTMLLITVSTTAISLLPTYHSVGFAAIALLLFFRILQGIAFGAELPGAVTFIHESSSKQGMNTGILMVAIGIGDILASSTILLLVYFIGKEGISAGGWRIPFFLGGILAFLSFYLRNLIEETPEFIKYTKTGLNRAPFLELFKEINWTLILAGLGLCVLGPFLVIFNLYLPTYLSKYFQYDLPTIYLFNSLGIILAMLFSIICGLISDKIGALNILRIHVVVLPLLSFFLFKLLPTKNSTYVACLILLCQITSYSYYTGSLALLGKLFPIKVRYTSIAICYNIACCFASLTPMLMTYMIERSHNSMIPYWGIVFLCVLTLIIGIALKRNFPAIVSKN